MWCRGGWASRRWRICNDIHVIEERELFADFRHEFARTRVVGHLIERWNIGKGNWKRWVRSKLSRGQWVQRLGGGEILYFLQASGRCMRIGNSFRSKAYCLR